MYTLTVKDQKKFTSSRNLPESFMRPKEAIGVSKFKGDKMPGSWSVNDKFIKGETYPVYLSNDADDVFVVGLDGQDYKMTPTAWTKIKGI